MKKSWCNGDFNYEENSLNKTTDFFGTLRSFYIDFNSKKEALVGCSSVNGVIWKGLTCLFRNCEDLLSLKASGFYKGSTSSDAKFLNDRTIALAEDTGVFKIIKVDENFNFKTTSFYRHFSRIPQIAVWKNSMEVVTCSDLLITIYDANVSKPLGCYEKYHTAPIYSLDTLKQQTQCFVSCGADKKALLWDKRNDKIASVLYSNEFAALTSVAWNQIDDNLIACGTEGGDVYLLDKREPNSFLEVNHCLETQIHRISFNENSNQLAICGDTQEVIVLDCTQHSFKVLYTNSSSEGFVRGLRWNDNVLYSCGFGNKIYKHEL